MGLPVNVAARLQGVTKTFNNSFVISADAFDLLITKPENILKAAHLKGIQDVIPCYLIGKKYKWVYIKKLGFFSKLYLILLIMAIYPALKLHLKRFCLN